MCEKYIFSIAEKPNPLYNDKYYISWGSLYDFLEGQASEDNDMQANPILSTNKINVCALRNTYTAKNSRNAQRSFKSSLIFHPHIMNTDSKFYNPFLFRTANYRPKCSSALNTS